MSEHKHIEEEREFILRRWINITQENHILIAPVLSLAAFILLAVGDTALLTRVCALLLQIVLFQIVVTAHITRPRLRRRVFIFSPFAILGLLALIAVVSIFVSADWGRALATGFSALLTAGVIIRIFGRIAKAPVVNVYVVHNAVTVYLMLGLLFSYIFLTTEAVTAGAFFTQGVQPASTYLYFSYTTLATIGYGDFTAANTSGRFLAVAEGLMGQLYLVTVLALIVSNLGRQRKPSDDSDQAVPEVPTETQ